MQVHACKGTMFVRLLGKVTVFSYLFTRNKMILIKRYHEIKCYLCNTSHAQLVPIQQLGTMAEDVQAFQKILPLC